MQVLGRALIPLAVVGVLLTTAVASAQQNPAPTTLAEELRACGCLVAGMPASLLETRVAEAKYLVDGEGFVLAFWPYPSVSADAYGVISGNVAAARWRYATVTIDDNSKDAARHSGPLWSIRRLGPFIVVGLRVAIDGLGESIFSADLSRVAGTYGFVHAALPGGLIVYEHGQPHFAPTHYVRLAALDTRTGQEREIYPPRPYDRVRREMIRKERARYAALGRNWCNEMNHHCDPELFDNDTANQFAINDRTKAMTFRVFDRQWNADREAEVFVYDALVVCSGTAQLATIKCRETPIEAWKRLFPKDDDARLLERAAANPRRITP